jgi:hypothetical protein
MEGHRRDINPYREVWKLLVLAAGVAFRVRGRLGRIETGVGRLKLPLGTRICSLYSLLFA